MTKFRTVLLLAAALSLPSLAIAANTTLFSPSTGDVVFPFSPPARDGSAGAIDNMVIGATTPRAATFTDLTAANAPAGAGITALFASPPAIGGTAAAAGSFTTVTGSGLGTFASAKVDTGTKTAAASAGAATLNKSAGVITSEALTTAAGATYTLTLTDSTIAAADQVMASVALGTATTGMPVVATVTPAAGSVVIVAQNIHASAALNGTIKIAFVVFKN